MATSDPYSGYGGATGYFTDWETGLQLLGHRFYDSTSGRFLNRDPMDTGGGINVYGYVSNNPLDVADPSGYGDNEGGGGHGGGHGGGGYSNGGREPGLGRLFPGFPKELPKTGEGSRGNSGWEGCAMGAIAAVITTAGTSGNLLDWSNLCPLVMACLTGGLCGWLGAGFGGSLQDVS